MRREKSQNSVHTYNISGRHSPARKLRRSDHLYMVKTMRCKGVGSTCGGQAWLPGKTTARLACLGAHQQR